MPKVFVIDVPAHLQPRSAPFVYPTGSKDWGIEQEVDRFFRERYRARVTKPERADWFYLGVYWTRIHLANDYGRRGLSELQAEMNKILGAETEKVFTVCQYDDGPMVDVGSVRVYLGSRKDRRGHDAPLLAYPPIRPALLPTKRWFASFIGRYDTHPIREAVLRSAELRDDCLITDQLVSPEKYRSTLRKSWIALAPRGYGGSSFRFYEAVFAGAVPWLIGEADTRPFKSQIDWPRYSFYSESVCAFEKDFHRVTLEQVREKYRELRNLRYFLGSPKWCQALVNDLDLEPR